MLDVLMSALKYIGTAFLAALIAHYFTARHYRERKIYEFEERRLDELYGPLCSRLEQLKGVRESGVKGVRGQVLQINISHARIRIWQDLDESNIRVPSTT